MARDGAVDYGIVEDLDLEMPKMQNGLFPTPYWNNLETGRLLGGDVVFAPKESRVLT